MARKIARFGGSSHLLMLPRRSCKPDNASTARQPDCRDSPAARAVREAQAPAVRLDDLSTEGESQARARRLRREKGKQRIAQHILREAAAAVSHLDDEAFGRLA